MIEYDNKPYVYKLTHKETKQFYFGYRSGNKLPASSDLGNCYKTSSMLVKDIGFDKFDYEILEEFYHSDREVAADMAYNLENTLIENNFNDVLCLNQQFYNVERGKGRFRVTDEVREKQRLSMLGKNHSEESKLKISRTKTSKGRQVFSAEHIANMKSSAHRGKKPKSIVDKSNATRAENKRKKQESNLQIMYELCS